MKRGAQAIGNRALGAAIDVGYDVLEGKNAKQAIKSRGIESFKDIVHQGVKQSNIQSGGGRKRKTPINASVISKSNSRSQAKKQKTAQRSGIYF